MSNRFSPETDVRVIHWQRAALSSLSPAAQQLHPYFHYQCEFLLTVGGSAEFNVSGRVYHLKPGSVLCISNLENHFIISHSGDYDRYSILFSNDALATFIHDPLLLSIFKQRPEDFCHQYLCTEKETAHYAKMLDIMLREYIEQNAYWDYLIASKMRDILVYMYRHRPEAFPGSRRQAGQDVIFDIQNHIESHLAEDLRLDTIATKFYINKYYLSHSFKNVTGYAYKQYVVMARLSKAKDLLSNSADTIQDIADQVGFASTSHFIRSFRQAEGITPLKYRSQIQKKS